MARDWIKMRCDLRTHPKIVRVSSALKADRLRTLGALHATWSVFDAHSIDGILPGYTFETMDDEIGWRGFCKALAAPGVEWIEQTPEGLKMPRFEAHNGESAKRRAEDAERKRSQRTADRSRTEPGQSRDQRREEVEVINTSTVTTGTGAEKDPTDVGLPPQRQPRPTTRAVRATPAVDRTKAIIQENLLAAARATPPPGGSAMELLKRASAGKGNGTPAPEPPPPREPGQDEDEIEDLADSNDLDLEASSLGMKRMAFENDDALQARITARRALG